MNLLFWVLFWESAESDWCESQNHSLKMAERVSWESHAGVCFCCLGLVIGLLPLKKAAAGWQAEEWQVTQQDKHAVFLVFLLQRLVWCDLMWKKKESCFFMPFTPCVVCFSIIGRDFQLLLAGDTLRWWYAKQASWCAERWQQTPLWVVQNLCKFVKLTQGTGQHRLWRCQWSLQIESSK